MNPNSTHQVWSKWSFTVKPGRTMRRRFVDVQANCARFGKKGFGSATEMRVTERRRDYVIEVRTEGHPVHDAAYVAWMKAQWERFFTAGFGQGTVVTLETKLEAGSRQDGTPADQLIILPPLAVV